MILSPTFSTGKIADMRCTPVLQIINTSTWTDNYLCVPHNYTYYFQWYSSSPIDGLECITLNEPDDTTIDSYLCASDKGNWHIILQFLFVYWYLRILFLLVLISIENLYHHWRIHFLHLKCEKRWYWNSIGNVYS